MSIQGILLLIWFWLMGGILFCSATIFYRLFEHEKWYLKVLCWPYYLVRYYIQYLRRNNH